MQDEMAAVKRELEKTKTKLAESEQKLAAWLREALERADAEIARAREKIAEMDKQELE